jgi:hypothetical protein
MTLGWSGYYVFTKNAEKHGMTGKESLLMYQQAGVDEVRVDVFVDVGRQH